MKDNFFLQSLAAGTPKLLSGGIDRNQPQRAIVAVCDANYRLLSFQVGVPDEQNMLTLIEDAQFVQTLLQLHPGEDAKNSVIRFDEVVEYNAKRMPRLWNEALKAMIQTVWQDADEDASETDTTNRNAQSLVLNRRLLARIGESFEEIYLTDVKQRFALSEASDLIRLAVIEQHPQARQPWCDAMIPFVAGSDVRTHWRYLAELVWKRPPVIDSATVQDAVIKNNDDEILLDWWDQKIESDMVIFAIKPAILASLRPWPPINVDNVADKRGLGWKDLENAAAKHSFRHVTHQQLATLMQSRELKPINILLPAPARYAMFEQRRQQGVAIRENELPAKYIHRLKRSTKN